MTTMVAIILGVFMAFFVSRSIAAETDAPSGEPAGPVSIEDIARTLEQTARDLRRGQWG
jgi:hypothetical protein